MVGWLVGSRRNYIFKYKLVGWLVGSRRNKRPKTSGKFTLPVLCFLGKIVYPTRSTKIKTKESKREKGDGRNDYLPTQEHLIPW